MKREIQEPTVTKDDSYRNEGQRYDHPAFGQIGASRVSGRATLYGSEFQHNATIRLRIMTSQLHRDLHRDWRYAGKELIEVEMSEAQWATLVSSLNVGEGAPCTIRHIQGKQMPALPDPSPKSDIFKDELDKKLVGMIETVKASIAEIEGLGLTKTKASAATAALRKTLQEMESNLPYAAQTFGEHMEEVVEKAKSEVHGYMTGVIQRTGISALQGQPLPLSIAHDPDA